MIRQLFEVADHEVDDCYKTVSRLNMSYNYAVYASKQPYLETSYVLRKLLFSMLFS